MQFKLILLYTATTTHSLQCLLKGDYLLQYRVEEYLNSMHIRGDGFSCDSDSSNDECENRFLFCLRPVGFNRSSEECPLGNYSTGVIANDSVVFAAGEDLDVGVPNPLVFNGAGAWPVSVYMHGDFIYEIMEWSGLQEIH